MGAGYRRNSRARPTPIRIRAACSSVVPASLGAGVEGLRIGILEQGFEQPVQEAVVEAVLNATEVLAATGATLRRISVPEHR